MSQKEQIKDYGPLQIPPVSVFEARLQPVYSEQHDAVETALSLLGAYPAEALTFASNFEGNAELGGIENYVVMPDGRSISQGDFFGFYIRLINKSIDQAKQLISSGMSLDKLRVREKEANDFLYSNDQTLYCDLFPDGTEVYEPIETLARLDGYLKRRIVHLSESEDIN